MAALSSEIKREIVIALARFLRPAEVAVMIREEHDIEIDAKQVVIYDPTRSTFAAGDDLKLLFEATRKAFLENVNEIPIASQAYRLNILQGNLNGALKQGNKVLAGQILEQAAKEVGGVLTNERNLNVDSKKGGIFADLTPEERRAAVVEIMREAVSNRQPAIEAPAKEATG